MRIDNIRMLDDTIDILKKGSYKVNNKQVKLKLSSKEQHVAEVLLPDDVKRICENPTIEKVFFVGRTGHFCKNEDSYAVAMRAREQLDNPEVLVLNFANPVNPGGGVRHGANAQEEDLCQRAPGNTCISAIKSKKPGSVEEPINDSKGCGGIMRVAPLALHYGDIGIEDLNQEGAEIAAITHGHSLGYMPAAVLTHIISKIVYPGDDCMELKDIVIEAKNTVHQMFKDDKHINELDKLIDLAIELSTNNESDIDNIHKLGEGWVAEETLAIAIYCSLKYKNDFSKGVIAAVNHNGDSDSTGAVTGNILGALLGFEAIESKWKNNLELSEILDEMSLDLCHGCAMNEYGHYRDVIWISKYIDMRRPNAKPLDTENMDLGTFINSSGYYYMNDALRNGLI